MEILEDKHCTEIFALEIWEKILGNLGSKDLLTYRLVCKDLSQLVDGAHEAKIWKPYFPRSNFADVLLIFKNKGIGTRFTSAEEVEQFVATVEGSPNNKDPFINGTLILECRSVQNYAGLLKAFPTLVATFGNSIRQCVYFVHSEVPESVTNIRTILELTNLRTLSIYCAVWSMGEGLTNYLRNFKFGAQTPRKLNSVTVLGLKNPVFLRALFSTNLPTVKRLNYWGYNLDGGSSLTACSLASPNIEELKVSDICRPELSVLAGIQWPRLKRLSLKINAEGYRTTLCYILDSIMAFAGTLESFHLQMGKGRLEPDTLHENLGFPKVTDFRVSYSLGKQYVDEFAKIFGNMKHFQLVSDECVRLAFTYGWGEIEQVENVEL